MTFPEHMLRKLFSATVHLCCSTDAGISVCIQFQVQENAFKTFKNPHLGSTAEKT